MKNAHNYDTALSNRSLDRLDTSGANGGVLGRAENAAVRTRVKFFAGEPENRETAEVDG